MTIASTARKAGPLLGNGSTTSFSFSFKVFATSDIKVAIANSAGVETVLVENTHYTVSLNANQETSPGGAITYPISGSPLPSGSVLSIIGDLDYGQPLDLPSGGNFNPTALENQLDRTVMQVQQLKEQVDRSAKLPQTSSQTPDELVFNITRLSESADNIDTVAPGIAAVTTVAADIADVNTVAGSIGNVNATGANIDAVVTVANDLNEPVSEIETVAANITNVNATGSNIASVNTVAGISSAVSTVAGIAPKVSIVADNVADVTNFSDVYYGPSATNPTLRKDGSALQGGDLYFNTGTQRLRVFDGATWVDGPVNAGTITRDTFSGTGAQTAFTLSADPVSENNTQVFIGGVYQQKSEYSVSGTALTFASAPPAGTNNIEVLSTTTLALGTTTANLVGYLPDFAGSVATNVKNFLDRIISLDNGSTSHSDGTNTITGSPRWFIGNKAPSTDDSALLIGRGLTGSYFSGAHAVRDETTYNSSGTGFHAYASFDAIPTLSGSQAYNHLHAFQARPAYSGSGGIDQLAGFTFQANHAGTGTVTAVRGFTIEDCQGAGPITNQYGIWINPLTRGASNFAIYSGSTALPSYHGGRWQMGTAPQITAAGFTTFGAILSHDGSGNLLSNPNLKIVNGVLTMANATTSQITSSVAFALKLDAVGVVESLKPHKFPVYTVATLPTASSYSYCRVFVSDANATTFNSIVAGGGTNKVPVFSDGTNWRIG